MSAVWTAVTVKGAIQTWNSRLVMIGENMSKEALARDRNFNRWKKGCYRKLSFCVWRRRLCSPTGKTAAFWGASSLLLTPLAGDRRTADSSYMYRRETSAVVNSLITVGSDDLYQIVTLKYISNALMKRIKKNYRQIVGFNSGLIALGVAGVLPPTTTALLHNSSTILISLNSMKNLLE